MFWCSPRKKRRDSRGYSPLTPTPSEVEKNNPEDRTDAESCLPLESSKDSAHRSRRPSYHTANDSSPEPGPATVEREEVVRMLASNNDQLVQHMEARMEAIVLENNNKLEAKIVEKVKTVIQIGMESSADQSTEAKEKCAAGTSAQQQLISRKQHTPLTSSNRMAKGKNPSAQNQHSKLPQEPCDNKILVWLSSEVTSWKFVARRLGLSECDISRIEKDNPNQTREQCYQMLIEWKSKYPENDTYQVLGKVLNEESPKLFQDYVEEVKKIKDM